MVSTERSRSCIPAIRHDRSDFSGISPAVDLEGHGVLTSWPVTVPHECSRSRRGFTCGHPGPAKETKRNPYYQCSRTDQDQDGSGRVGGGSVSMDVMKSEPSVHPSPKSPDSRVPRRGIDLRWILLGGQIMHRG